MMTKKIDLTLDIARCPGCNRECKRHSKFQRVVKGLHHVQVELTRSRHYCRFCNFYFSTQDPRFPMRSQYTAEVHECVVNLIQDEGHSLAHVC